MRTVAVAVFVLLAALVPAGRAQAAACGLPDSRPLWIDYAEGSVGFRDAVFARPGIVAATSGAAVPQALRNGGARTVYWHMKLGALVGTTTAPADPTSIGASAQKLFDAAAASSGCSTPLIALNELNGASTTTPWTTTNSRYRQNVLDLLRALQSRGARPFLLVSSFPYTGGDAADWWRQAARVADIVPEVYFNAPAVMRQGVILGSRRMRVALRAAVAAYTAIGIPVSRLGFVLGFQSGPGAGGREGLQPSSMWFRYAKLYTLAAKRVAAEFGVATVWTWGWGTFGATGADPDKEVAACVYLWTRDPALCEGPSAAGPDFEASRTEGQIALPEGVQCSLDGRLLRQTDLSRMTAVTHDRDVAFTILYDRLVESGLARIPSDRVSQAIQAIVAGVFAGSRPAYSAALARAGANGLVARAAVADELLRAQIEDSLPVAAPTESAARVFYVSYSNILIRAFKVQPAAPWLGNRTTGFALAATAPAAVFRLPSAVASSFTTGLGSYTVTPLGGALPLGAVPYGDARAAIRTALLSFARTQAYEDGARKRAESALNRSICLRDDLPSPALVSVSTYLPFLALGS
ncbi:MAG: hypothetical protein ACM3QU_02900 [Verrucomicrobiota bacterium]